MLTRLLERDRRLFEHWTHDAAIIPATWLWHWRRQFERFERSLRESDWFQRRIGRDPEKVIEHVRQRIAAEGPLMSRDFEHPERKSGPWWGWKPQKAALEYLWWTGTLAVTGRENFHKKYDLMERVFPDHRNGEAPPALPMPSPALPPPPVPELCIDWACRAAFERLVTATPGQIAEFWRLLGPKTATQWCEAAHRRGELAKVLVERADGGRPRAQFALANWRQRLRTARAAPLPERMRLLSPFDPIVRDRKRLEHLFGFDYRFEAFVPAAKRKHGYYVLPVLEGDRFVGRVDPKFHRDEGVLKIRKVWWEPGIKATRAQRAALEQAVDLFARQIGAERWELPTR
jgi:hypothetical protein